MRYSRILGGSTPREHGEIVDEEIDLSLLVRVWSAGPELWSLFRIKLPSDLLSRREARTENEVQFGCPRWSSSEDQNEPRIFGK